MSISLTNLDFLTSDAGELLRQLGPIDLELEYGFFKASRCFSAWPADLPAIERIERNSREDFLLIELIDRNVFLERRETLPHKERRVQSLLIRLRRQQALVDHVLKVRAEAGSLLHLTRPGRTRSCRAAPVP